LSDCLIEAINITVTARESAHLKCDLSADDASVDDVRANPVRNN